MSHAQLYFGNYETVLPYLGEDFRANSPDVSLHVVYNLKVAEARRISVEVYQKPLHDKVRTIVVAFVLATREAQNALLKALEDPAESTRIIVIVPQAEILLPTVRSRLTLMCDASREVVNVVGSEFLSLSLGERSTRITKEFTAAKKSDTEKERVARWANDVLDAIETHIHTQSPKNHEAIRDIIFVRSYWNTPAASQKMLLEHLILA